MSDITTQLATGASNIPDSRGINFHTVDPDFSRLLRLHLGEALYAELESQFVSLGQRASDELDTWALTADKNPPQLRHRTRRGTAKHRQAFRLRCAGTGRLFGIGPRVDESREWRESAAARQIRVDVPVRAGRIRVLLPRQHDRFAHAHAAQIRRAGTGGCFLPMLASCDFDTLFQGAMFMTEQAAGSDVARIATRASQGTGANGETTWRLYGDKWFCSNADADLAMVLAWPDTAPEGINGLGLFCCRKRCRTARVIATGSCA